MKKIKITERGWAGHFCAASNCAFRRNTLIEYGNKRIVVSTVGNYKPLIHSLVDGKYDKHEQEIGLDRTYETMAFEAIKEGVYWEANVSKEIHFNSNWKINELKTETDLKANEMHEKVVKEIANKLSNPTRNKRG